MTRQAGETCATCKHWLSSDGTRGVCRALPPDVDHNIFDGVVLIQTVKASPRMTNADYSCGLWTVKGSGAATDWKKGVGRR